MLDLSIVIPAYNEAKRLPKTLATIEKLFHDREPRVKSFEVIVVDDGSSDGTSDYVKTEKLKNLTTIRLDKNFGKGYAVKTGVMAAKGQYILMMDADGSIPIGELDKLWPCREQFEVVIGSRFLTGGRFGTQNFKRLLVSKIGNLLFSLLFRMNIHDTQCGFKLFRAEAAKKIFKHLTINRFGFDMEMLVLAKHFGYGVKEVPIDWHDSLGSSIRAVRTSWQTFQEMVKIWQKYQ